MLQPSHFEKAVLHLTSSVLTEYQKSIYMSKTLPELQSASKLMFQQVMDLLFPEDLILIKKQTVVDKYSQTEESQVSDGEFSSQVI